MKRPLLIAAALLILGVAIVFPSANAHAQSTQQASKTTVTFDSDSFPFDAGLWGWGICLSHNDTQSIHSSQDLSNMIVAIAAYKISSFTLGLISGSAWLFLDAVISQDQGRGVCMAWPYYIPSTVPIVWSR